jgi:dTDP-4-dehydrorhamnose 3,5-epimerase
VIDTTPTGIPGCHLLRATRVADSRGDFMKLSHATTFCAMGMEAGFVESYITTSRRGVIRGMHFQHPPHDHAKLVACLTGAALDVVLDLRHGSPTFGCSRSFELTGSGADLLYMPSGVAHGFAALCDDTRMLYLVTSEHVPEAEGGIRWDSFGFAWPFAEPMLSQRDRQFLAFSDFVSPFLAAPTA